jgi:hypothetical protein
VGRLISQSPQLDDLRSTEHDGIRCGGASLLNGMLLDGGYEANSDAIRATAADRGVTLSHDEDAALTSMHGGHLTSRQAATLQDTMFRIAHQGSDEDGVSLPRVDDTARTLRSHGAFAQSRDVTFEAHPHHCTVSVDSTTGGPATADSWPGPNGYAHVQAGVRTFADPTLDGSTTFHSDGRETFRARIEPDGQPPLVMEQRPNPAPAAPSRTFHDPATGALVIPSCEDYGQEATRRFGSLRG